MVRRAAPAVVNVYGSRVEQVQAHPFFDDPIFRRFFGDRGGQGRQGGPQRAEVARSLGSGVIVERSGLVITNNHVVENMTEVKVALADRREFEVDIVLRDPRTDLAVLRMKSPPADLATIEIGDSDALEVGDLVLAIGNPFGVGQTVTQGIVSALARTQVGVADYQSFVQTDAAINPGNSGGALVDMSGRLIGVNTAIFSRSGGSHGIGFAIPTALVRLVVESAKAGSQTVRRPWFGGRLQTVTADVAESLRLARPTGALVVSVVPNSPAARAGLRAGDLITAVDNQAVEDPDGFGYRFGVKPIGGMASIAVTRDGRSLVVPVALEPAPPGGQDAITITGPSPFAASRSRPWHPAWRTNCASATAVTAWSSWRSSPIPRRPRSASSPATSSSASTAGRSSDRRPARCDGPAGPPVALPDRPRRPDHLVHAGRLRVDLFEAAGPDPKAPRPLADRLRRRPWRMSPGRST